MVGIEDEDSKELEGASFDPDSLNNLFENILITLSQLTTESSGPGPDRNSNEENQDQNQRRRTRPNSSRSQFDASDDNSSSRLTDSFSSASVSSKMTILPKKKAHKERNEQREHRHHAHGASSSQAAGYSEYPSPDFGQEPARMPHPEIDHRSGNLSDVIHGHGHHHPSGFQPQSHNFAELPNAEAYRQPFGDRSATSSSSMNVRHERNVIGSRKERPSAQYDLESGCHAKKRCLSPGFSDKNFPPSQQGASCGLPAHQGLYQSSHPQALLPGSSAQEDICNSDDNNSEDEYYGNITRKTIEDEEKFAQMMEKKGWCIKQMASDGACLFRAVADQIYGDQEMHDEVRTNCLNYMSKNEEHFSQYVTEDFAKYIARKRNVHCHGNHLEIQALAEVYNRPIEIYYYDIEPRNVFHGEYKTDYPPIRLSYHGSVHYNSIREPYSATVGIGLGLPEFEPGLADKQLLSEAIKRSEENQIEEAMLKDKMRDTDWDLMQSQIENQIAEESYKEYVNSRLGGSNASSAAACGGGGSGVGVGGGGFAAGTGRRSPRSKQQQHQLLPLSPRGSPPISAAAVVGSPRTPPPPTSIGASAAAVVGDFADAGLAAAASTASASPAARSSSTMQMPATNLVDYLPAEMSDWDENAILARALAESTLHYYESMRRDSSEGQGAAASSYDSGQPGCSKHS
ncbi:hypothetical protein BOX15_Mlig016383g4 [Macrostomum lignano]|uniref:ubiquitinyl hydrolase 1 n=1 Tax=Macrostomum lignano TaxID=282301 RepID=A0A267E0Y9_9PLAT|nr:hypothetical protein BOX15_Mlig016383g4 [Macrostomum lignano]